MFFVLNTGRAGSKTIAKVLSQSPDCTCLHEPEPRLISEAPRYRYGEVAADELVEVLLRTRPEPEGSGEYGESNNRMGLIVPVLEQAFPACRYVWLVRDGRDVVASALDRGWFTPAEYDDDANMWQQWRMQGDLLGDVTPTEWEAWDPFERNCWLWDRTNRIIRDDVTALDPDRLHLVRIEQLGADLPALCEFLEITPTSFVLERANRRSVVAPDGEANAVERISTWQEWTPGQREVFASHCGELMDELYPAWRTDGDWHRTDSEVPTDDRTVLVRTARDDTAHVDEAPGSAELAAMRADLSEMKLIRGEIRSLARLLHDAERRADRHQKTANDRLHEAREERKLLHKERATLTEARDRAIGHHDRMVDELARLQGHLERAERERQQLVDRVAELETTAARGDRLERDLAAARRSAEEGRVRLERTLDQRDQARRRVRSLETSTSYRVGHGAALLVREPGRTLQRAWNRLRAPEATHTASAVDDPTAATVAERLQAPVAFAAGEPATPGPSDGALLSETLPTVAYVLLGLQESALATTVQRLRQAAQASGTHLPLVVTDSDAFSELREAQIAFEYVPSPATWREHRPDQPWGELLAERLAQIRRDHDVVRTVVVTVPDGLDVDLLLALGEAAG